MEWRSALDDLRRDGLTPVALLMENCSCMRGAIAANEAASGDRRQRGNQWSLSIRGPRSRRLPIGGQVRRRVPPNRPQRSHI